MKPIKTEKKDEIISKLDFIIALFSIYVLMLLFMFCFFMWKFGSMRFV